MNQLHACQLLDPSVFPRVAQTFFLAAWFLADLVALVLLLWLVDGCAAPQWDAARSAVVWRTR